LEDLMLRSVLTIVSLLLPIAPAFGQTAPAANPNAAASYRVVYLEVAPADVNRVAAALKEYRQAATKALGALRIDVLQQIGRSNHFAVYESWRDNAALEAHRTTAETRKLDDVLQATRVSPIDERLLSVVGPPSATVSGTGAIYVVTHADSVPPQRDAAAAALTELTIRSRQEAGNALFLATVQPNRNNHFTIIELWKDEKALDAHAVAEHTKKFRDTFGPFSGALFDERIYKSLT
jgi:quinol monooxygenase YgiN